MIREATFTDAEAIRVVAPVNEFEIPVGREVMSAVADPADPDQAILTSVPFLIDGLNFGDIVRLGAEDEQGARPIAEVVESSGHVHMLAAAEPGDVHGLRAQLERTFPGYALRIGLAGERLISVSVHPDLDPEDVAAVIEAWLGEGLDPEEGLAFGPACRTKLGPLG